MRRIILYIHGMGGGSDSRIPAILNERINTFFEESLGDSAADGVGTDGADDVRAAGGNGTDEADGGELDGVRAAEGVGTDGTDDVRAAGGQYAFSAGAIRASRAACENKKIEVVVRTYDFDPQIAHDQIESWVKELNPSLIIGESLGSIHAIRIKGLPHILISPSLNAPLYFKYLSFLTLIPGVTYLLSKVYKTRSEFRQLMPFKFHILKKYGKHIQSALSNSPQKGGQDYFYAFFGEKDHYRKSGIVSVRTYEKYFKPLNKNQFCTENAQNEFYEIYKGTHFMEEEFIVACLIPKILSLSV